MKIEKGIEINNGKRAVLPVRILEKMEVGDSVFVEGDEKRILSARASFNYYGKRSGKKFTSQIARGFYDELIGVRVWRIK